MHPLLLSLLIALVSASPLSVPDKPLPLIIWHGLGDRFDADGLHSVGKLAQQIHPGTYVHYIHTDPDGSTDRKNSFLGNVTAQLEQVCSDLQQDPRLWRYPSPPRSPHSFPVSDHDREQQSLLHRAPEPPLPTLRVDAIGFSQGGQFLRGLVQQCAPLQVRSLLTFGSQHNGITAFQRCGTWDFVCRAASALMQDNAWTDTVQGQVVPAQYYRPMNGSSGLPEDGYRSGSRWLADVNGEAIEEEQENGQGMVRTGAGGKRNELYASRIAKLSHLVMFVFGNDTTVIPKESGWFAEVYTNTSSTQSRSTRDDDGESTVVVPLQSRPLYTEDWIGLRQLDQKQDGLVFRLLPGRKHMELDDDTLSAAFVEFLGAEKKQRSLTVDLAHDPLHPHRLSWPVEADAQG